MREISREIETNLYKLGFRGFVFSRDEKIDGIDYISAMKNFLKRYYALKREDEIKERQGEIKKSGGEF